ncbi:MAG TPA: Rne/Rng family ribonuclease [Tepidisphaeraceae bacterium]|jgi:ribonuclease E|nr:Rne/Rng family ribonuclease [Tepidisphaeraceae bacterium]
MAKEMLINVSEGEECRIALVADGKLQDLYMERTSSTSHVNNIYKGRVTNVEPSIQAAFIDFGLGRNGFLHISDLMPTYFGRVGEDIQESVGRKMARRDRPPIQRCLRRGDDIVVQVIKEGIGTKGPTLSTYLSIPGRILVMMPGMASKGVSRKIEDEDERRRLRKILDELDPPDDAGFILRTAGVGKSKAEIERDLKYLTRLWDNLKRKRDAGPGPTELYTEGDLVSRTVRDLFTSDIERIVIDSADVAARVREVIKLSNPRSKDRVDLYEEPLPLFHKYGIEKEIEQMYSRHVPLPSGGSLVIDSTEAIVAIDVNSGKFRDHSDAETTAYKIDMEAADEICRQLKLRDLGGVIICDFIDLRYERHRNDLERRINENLKDDRAKTKVLPMSQFGIVEMTRQRMRPSLKRSVYFDCPHCKGAGLVKSPESMSLDVMRRLAIAVNDLRVVRVELAVCPDVSLYLQNKKRRQLAGLEGDSGKRIVIRPDQALGLDEMQLTLFDARDGLVMIEELAAVMTAHPHTSQLHTRPAQPPVARGGRPGGKPDDRRQRAPQPQPRRGGQDEDRSDMDREADELEDRTETLERAAEESGAPSPVVSGPPQRQGGGQHPNGPRQDGRRQDNNRRDQGPRQGQGDQRRQDPRDSGQNRQGGQRPNGPRDGSPRDFGQQQRPGGNQFANGPRDNGPRDNAPRDNGPRNNAPRRPGLPLEARAEGADELLEAGNNGSSEQSFAGGDEQGGGHKRRRRRRGRRGRGRGGQGQQPFQDGQTAPQEGNAAGNDRGPGDDQDFHEGEDARGEEGVGYGEGFRDREEATARGETGRDDRADHAQEAGDRHENADRAQAADRDDAGDRGRFEDRHHDEERGHEHELPQTAGFEGRRDDNAGAFGQDRPTESDEREGVSEAMETSAYASREPEESKPAQPQDRPEAQDEAAELVAKPKRGGRKPAKPAAPAAKAKGGRRKPPVKAVPAAKSQPSEDAESPAEGEEAKPKGRRRGGRGRGGKKPAAEKVPATASRATAREPEPAPVAPVVRTGSADRHLADDEPVHHEPIRRPRNLRDLDTIPEDFD